MSSAAAAAAAWLVGFPKTKGYDMKFKPLAGSIAGLSLICGAVAFAGAVEAAVPSAPLSIVNKAILDSGSTIAFTSPAAAVGPDHNVHIVAEGMNPGLGLD